jgi:NitT/TauT family transport system permease protein
MARSFGANGWQAFSQIYVWAALPEILAGIRLGVIRGVKGVVIGQLLVSVVGFGTLFEIYQSHFLMEHFWALLLVLFAFAFALNEALERLQRRFAYFAASR